MEDPLVSVIIAVKNAERYLAQALESVVAQTYGRHEIIVVDGDSSDRSLEIARSFPGVRCMQETGTGFAGAWNDGVAASGGELIAFLDSDDVWEPVKLERQVALLRARPKCDYVITRMRFMAEPGEPLPHGFRPELLDGDHPAPMPSAVMIRRAAFDALGPFRTDYSIASDIEWFARAKDLPLELGTVPEVLLRKRVHSANLSFTAAENLGAELLELLRASAARRR